jgi:hypothetical protein
MASSETVSMSRNQYRINANKALSGRRRALPKGDAVCFLPPARPPFLTVWLPFLTSLRRPCRANALWCSRGSAAEARAARSGPAPRTWRATAPTRSSRPWPATIARAARVRLARPHALLASLLAASSPVSDVFCCRCRASCSGGRQKVSLIPTQHSCTCAPYRPRTDLRAAQPCSAWRPTS